MSNNFLWTIHRLHLFFIETQLSINYLLKKIAYILPLVESKCQNHFFAEKLLKYYDIFNKSWVKKGSKLNNAYHGNKIW